MAIMEFLEETFPNVKLLPKDALTRAKVFDILIKFTINIYMDMYIVNNHVLDLNVTTL